jgi:hypothetical protein
MDTRNKPVMGTQVNREDLIPENCATEGDKAMPLA